MRDEEQRTPVADGTGAEGTSAECGGEHSAKNIEVLEGLEPVRRRPGMYIGDVHDGSGLHHVLWEVVANTIDLYLARRATLLSVRIADGWVEVADDGPGFPAGNGHSNRSFVELALTVLHCGSTRDGHHYHVHLSSHGLGLAVVNAVSEELELETHTAGQKYSIQCQKGKVTRPFTPLGPTSRSGSRIRFRPDASIFASTEYDLELVRARLQELAYLCPGLTIRFQDETFREPRGLQGMVEQTVNGSVFATSGVFLGIHVDVALGWRDRGKPDVKSYVGMDRSDCDGAHVEGLWTGLRESIYYHSTERPRDSLLYEGAGEGLVAAVNVGMFGPEFAGPTRSYLRTRKAAHAVETALLESLPRWLREHSSVSDRLDKRLRLI